MDALRNGAAILGRHIQPSQPAAILGDPEAHRVGQCDVAIRIIVSRAECYGAERAERHQSPICIVAVDSPPVPEDRETPISDPDLTLLELLLALSLQLQLLLLLTLKLELLLLLTLKLLLT